MARLHDRMIKADFYTDSDVIRWPRDKRMTYIGLWSMAADSGCFEDDPTLWRVLIFPGTLDADITEEKLALWRDELVREGKLIPYEANGKRYLFLTNFHRHQTLKNPGRPDVPLPPWLQWMPYGSNDRAGRYEIDNAVLKDAYAVLTSDLRLPSPGLQTSSKARKEKSRKAKGKEFPTGGDKAPAETDTKNPQLPEEDQTPPSDSGNVASAATIMAGCMRFATEQHLPIDGRYRGHLAREIQGLLKAGHDPDQIQQAGCTLIKENRTPTHLAYVVGDLARGGHNGERDRTTRISHRRGRSSNGEF